MSDRSFAVAQTCPVPGDVPANVVQHATLVKRAAEHGARLVLFPELSLTGYELPLAESLAFTPDDARLDPLAAAAATYAVTVIAGAPVRIGAHLYIAAFVVSPAGSTAVYTKRHLGAFGASAAVDGTVPPAEATVFHAGNLDPLVPLGSGSAVIAVCADIGHVSHPRRAAARGARAYLASMFVIPSEFAADAAKLRGYAVQYRMPVAMANYGGPTGGLAAAGRSGVWAETGELLVQLDARGAGVAVVAETAHGWRATRTMMADRIAAIT